MRDEITKLKDEMNFRSEGIGRDDHNISKVLKDAKNEFRRMEGK